MPASLNCPTCGAPLQYDGGPDRFLLCRHCGNTIPVPKEFQSKPTDDQPQSLDLNALLAQAGQWGEIARMVRDGRKIEATQLYRELTGAGLKESKEAIEQLAAGRVLTVARRIVAQAEAADGEPQTADGGQRPSTEDFLRSLQPLLQTDQKIEAIKRLRERYGLGLQEAKEAVELLQTGRLREAAAGVQLARNGKQAATRPGGPILAWYAVGCLFALSIPLLVLGVLTSGWPLSASGSFTQALSAAQNDVRVTEAFGGRVERGWGLITGEISCGSRCSADYIIPIQGPRGSGKIWVRSNTLDDNRLLGLIEGTWILDAVVTTPDGRTILLKP